MIKASYLLFLPELSNMNCYLQSDCVREEIMEAEVANKVSGPNCPDKSMEARESFVYAHITNQL